MLVAAIIGTILLAATAGGGARATIGRATQKTSYPLENSEQTRRILQLRAQALAEGNAIWMSSHDEAPCCVDCLGVRYIMPPPCGHDGECQAIQDAAALLDSHEGTCIEIAAYEAGALMRDGHNVEVVLEQKGEFDYHCVLYVDGARYDPTEELLAGGLEQGCKGGCIV